MGQFENDYSEVGNGYRNVYYSTVKDEDGAKHGEITLLGYDLDGKPRDFHFPYRVSVAYHIKGDKTDTGEVDLYGEPLRRKYFDTAYERREWLKTVDSSNSMVVLEAFPPEDAFIMDVFGHRLYDDDYNQNPLRIHFFDIEIAVENTFPYPEESAYPINIITILDSVDRQYYSWVVSDTGCENTLGEYDGCPVNLFKFGNDKLKVDLDYRFAKGEIDAGTLDAELRKSRELEEKKMLRHFIDWTRKHRPDVYSGWNSRAFDMPYIIRRVEKVLGKKWAAGLCHGGAYKARKLIFEGASEGGEQKKPDRNNTVYTMAGVSQMDLQVLYRDKFKIRSALDGGYGLNNVSLVELDDEKVKHEESFNNFWKVNFQKYWEYNVQDVSLVYRLEEHLGLITQARMITSIGSTNLDSIYRTIQYITQSLAMFSKTKHGKTWQTYRAGGKTAKGEKYTGAFVFEVQAGVYRHGEATVDYNSLYPNTDRSLNLSPETKMGVVFGDWDNPDEQLYIVPNERVWPISAEARQKLLTAQAMGLPGVKLSRKALAKLLDKTCCCSVAITRKDGMVIHVLFKKFEVQPGIFSEWLGFYFDRRTSLKKVRAGYEDKADELKKALKAAGKDEHEINHDPEYAENHDLYRRYDNLQQATKILINSAYGTLGTPSSPIYDVDLAETTTLNGQFANKSAARRIKEIYQERYGAPEDFVPQLSGDTDSVTGDMTVEAAFSDSLAKALADAGVTFNDKGGVHAERGQ